MTTLGDVVRQARQLIQGSTTEARIVTSADWSPGDDTLGLVGYPAGLVVGTSLEVGWTELIVVNVDPGNTLVTVVPEDGTILQPIAAGTVGRIRPRFPLWQIMSQVNNELRALSAPANGLFRAERMTVVSGEAFEVPSDIIKVLRAYTGTDDLRLADVDIKRGLDTATYGTGTVLTGGASSAVIARPFRLYDEVDPTSDVTSHTGLPDTATDILALGVGIRATAAREAKRSDTSAQGDTKRAQETPPGSASYATREYARQRQVRIVEEAERLTRTWGIRR